MALELLYLNKVGHRARFTYRAAVKETTGMWWWKHTQVRWVYSSAGIAWYEYGSGRPAPLNVQSFAERHWREREREEEENKFVDRRTMTRNHVILD